MNDYAKLLAARKAESERMLADDTYQLDRWDAVAKRYYIIEQGTKGQCLIAKQALGLRSYRIWNTTVRANTPLAPAPKMMRIPSWRTRAAWYPSHEKL